MADTVAVRQFAHSSELGSVPARVTWVHGVLLIMGSWCTVLAAGAVSPVLPQIRDAFATAPRLDLMVGFVATMPSLAVALFAIPLGRVADRYGLTQVMLMGLVLFGLAGVLPFWLTSLNAIVATRFIVGIGEAAVMITSTALIGLLFDGARRTRWLGLQVAVGNFLGIAVLLGGGYLGLLGWQGPFLIYSFGILLFVPCLFLVPRPLAAGGVTAGKQRSRVSRSTLLLVGESCALIFITSMALFTVIVQAGFLFELRGASDSMLRGYGMAAGATGIAVGATISGLVTSLATSTKMRIALVMMGGGLLGMMLAESFAITAAISLIAGFGSGFAIPALLSRLLGRLPADQMGSMTGWWIAATFAAQFANPPLFIVLNDIGGSQAAAIGMMGGICLLVGLLLPMLMRADKAENR